jgi:hypothetical protein
MEGQTVTNHSVFEQLGGVAGIVHSVEYNCLEKAVPLNCLPLEITHTISAEDRFHDRTSTASILEHANSRGFNAFEIFALNRGWSNSRSAPGLAPNKTRSRSTGPGKGDAGTGS